MKMVKYLSFVLVAFVFIGSAGVSMFIHHCNEDGDSLSFFFQEHDKCKKEASISCCSVKEQEDNCCSDEVKTLKADYNFVNQISKIQFKPSVSFVSKTNYTLQRVLFDFNTNYLFYDPPPLLYHSNILVFNQVFLI